MPLTQQQLIDEINSRVDQGIRNKVADFEEAIRVALLRLLGANPLAVPEDARNWTTDAINALDAVKLHADPLLYPVSIGDARRQELLAKVLRTAEGVLEEAAGQ